MNHTAAMLDNYPGDLGGIDRAALAECIQACMDCAQCCTACADCCLAAESVDKLRRCAGMALDCADICDTTARVMTRRTDSDTEMMREMLELCIRACGMCADECERHTSMAHCRVCAESCRRCEKSCRAMLKHMR